MDDPEGKRKKIQALWSCDRCPDHWSQNTLEDRARLTSSLEVYRDVYYFGNMFVHSGYIEFLKEPENAHLLCSYVYGICSDIIRKATEVVCRTAQISNLTEIQDEISRIHACCGYFYLWKTL